MAYNPYSAINAIYNLKNEWDAANKSGDTTAKNKAAENAKVYYPMENLCGSASGISLAWVILRGREGKRS